MNPTLTPIMKAVFAYLQELFDKHWAERARQLTEAERAAR